MCSGPSSGGFGTGGGTLRDANGNPVAPKAAPSAPQVNPFASLNRAGMSDQSNPFLISQTLGRLMIPNPAKTGVGDLKTPNPFQPPTGLVPNIRR